MNQPASKLQVLRRLLSYAVPYKRELLHGAVLLWFAAAAEICGPLLISYFIDHYIATNQWQLVAQVGVWLILGYLILQFSAAGLRYLQAMCFNRVAVKVVQILRNEVMKAALQLPIAQFDRQPVGQLISRVTNDTEVIKDLYATVLVTILHCFALVTVMLLAMFWLNWQMALIVMIIFPIIAVLILSYQHYSTPIIRHVRQLLAEINNVFNEAIGGMAVLQQMNQQIAYGDKLAHINLSHYRARMQALKIESLLLRPMLSLVSALILAGLLLRFGFGGVGMIGVGVLYAFITYLARLSEPLVELTSQQAILQQALVAGERVFELVDAPVECYGIEQTRLSRGEIIVKHVTFGYQIQQPVLHNISFCVAPQSFVALVGHTGSGKSTLANLLMGFYPLTQGQILLDGYPIQSLSHSVLRSGVALVQQDPAILVGTIYDNIVLDLQVSEEYVWQVLENVQLADFVKRLPNGLYTQLGEQGGNLSVGQKQLLALARVLLRTPKIIILDEATANIDSGTELAIQQVLNQLRHHTTLVVIAHRLSTIMEADSIIILHHGQLVEQGTHQQLLIQKGKYYQMYQLQMAAVQLENK